MRIGSIELIITEDSCSLKRKGEKEITYEEAKLVSNILKEHYGQRS
jgi:hypothetical protein